jgi:hypothetical protein
MSKSLALIAVLAACLLAATPVSAQRLHRCRGLDNGQLSPIRERGATCRIARHLLGTFVNGRRGRWHQTAPDGHRGDLVGVWKTRRWYCHARIPFLKLQQELAGPGFAGCVSRRHPRRVQVTARLNA